MKKNIKHILIAFPISFLFFSFYCNTRREDIRHTKKIVLIFDSIKSNYDTLFFENGAQSIRTGPILFAKLSPSNSLEYKMKDTIIIHPEREQTVLSHRYSPSSSVTFLLEKGDSIQIRYIDGVPFVSTQHRKIKAFDLNYDYYKRKRFTLVNGLQLSDIIRRPTALLAYKLFKGEQSTASEVLEEFRPQYMEELRVESLWLDSLYQKNQISTPKYLFYKERNKYATLSMNLNVQSPEYISGELRKYKDSIYTYDTYGFYKDYYLQVALIRANTILHSLKENCLTSSYDYIEKEEKEIIGKLSQDILEIILRKILDGSPIAERRKYYKRFSSSVSDTALLHRLSKEYEYVLSSWNTSPKDLILLSRNGNKTRLSDVLKKCEGKICYVDFWASWCAPCLSEMPTSHQLRKNKTYNNNVAFIYLSTDSKKEQWIKSWKSAELEDCPHNYLILNFKDSEFGQVHQINTIPRYMIFDRKGKLVNNDAPRPSSKELINYLEDSH